MPDSGPPGGRFTWIVMRSVVVLAGLTADGQVPVAEAAADHLAPGRPGAPAKHLVGVTEENLGVLGIRERLEARVGGEVRAGPLPDVAEHLDGAGVARRVGV